MIQRILCPTNFTENSKIGVAYALSLARENNAQVIFSHATAFPDLFEFPLEADGFCQRERTISNFKLDYITAEADLRLRNFVRATFGNEGGGVPWKTRVGLGSVTEQIVTAALQEEVDLIVMVRAEKTMLARLLTRGISEAVSRSASCPVLTIDATRARNHKRGWRVPVFREIWQSS
jgi:nucleotide-binding universal stress UspA family protein